MFILYFTILLHKLFIDNFQEKVGMCESKSFQEIKGSLCKRLDDEISSGSSSDQKNFNPS